MQPYYIVPLLVEQPTWGGTKIAEFKGISEPSIAAKKIGQAFELDSQSFVTSEFQEQMPFAFATATDLKNAQFFHQPNEMKTLQEVINEDPTGFLGQRALDQYGPEMKVLIKFTQAQNNSYQAHVVPGKEFSKWQAKPESWYYFDKGKATLGLKPETNVEEYKQRCLEIETKALQLSEAVQKGEKTVEIARSELKKFINQDHPNRFVNIILIEAGQIIDLSGGGIHHSWEMGPEIPDGNFLYEVQKDVKDEFCTLRSFDQGNMKDDGKVRPITIEDYFTALDSDPARNNPQNYLQASQEEQDSLATVTKLFDNQYYKTTAIEFSGEYSGKYSVTTDSFHHLFAQEGSAEVIVNEHVWKLPKGWSLILPANTGKYILRSTTKTKVLQTSL